MASPVILFGWQPFVMWSDSGGLVITKNRCLIQCNGVLVIGYDNSSVADTGGVALMGRLGDRLNGAPVGRSAGRSAGASVGRSTGVSTGTLAGALTGASMGVTADVTEGARTEPGGSMGNRAANGNMTDALACVLEWPTYDPRYVD